LAPVVEVDDQTFGKSVLEASVPVLVDFRADWCVPCRALESTLADIAGERLGSLSVCRLDADTNPVTVARYGVMGLPTLILFRDGQIVGRTSQARTRRDVEDFLAHTDTRGQP
jgi:thioredoxin 1